MEPLSWSPSTPPSSDAVRESKYLQTITEYIKLNVLKYWQILNKIIFILLTIVNEFYNASTPVCWGR
jgi:hypothetical protein